MQAFCLEALAHKVFWCEIQRFFSCLQKLKNGWGTLKETWRVITDFCIRLLIFFKSYEFVKPNFSSFLNLEIFLEDSFLHVTYLQCEILDEKTIRHTLCSKRGALPQGRRFCPVTGLIQWFSTNIQARKQSQKVFTSSLRKFSRNMRFIRDEKSSQISAMAWWWSSK